MKEVLPDAAGQQGCIPANCFSGAKYRGGEINNLARSSVRQSDWLLTSRPRVQIPTGPPCSLLQPAERPSAVELIKFFEMLYFWRKGFDKVQPARP